MKSARLISTGTAVLLLFGLMLGNVQAQSFSVKAKKLDGSGTPGSFIECYAELHNLTSSEIQVRIQRTRLEIPDGWSVSFCLVNCYSPEATDVIEPLPADKPYDLKPTWETSAIPGEGTVEYVLSSVSNPSETYTVTFHASTLQTGITEKVLQPKSLSLAQSYPNPFSVSGYSVTTIGYTVPKSGYVSLKVYNLVGGEVRTLIADAKNAGSYSALWDGRNNNGDAVPSGIYIYKLSSSAGTLSRRLLISR